MLPLLSWLLPSRSRGLWFGVLITLLGVGVRVWAAGWLHKNEALATGGPYRLARHPLYLGTGLMALGHGLMSGLPLAPLVLPTLWLSLYWPVMREEEAWLHGRYGTDYEEYRARTGLLWPRFQPKREQVDKIKKPPAAASFSWRQANRNREYEAVGINAALILFYIWLNASR